MKKILIGVIILLLLILGYFMCFKSITIGKFKVESINNIKDMSNTLNAKLEEANKISEQTYPKEISNLEDATKKLNSTKAEYEAKVAYTKSNEDVFSTYLRNYKIETLMVDLGRHSKQNGLKDLKLDLKTTKSIDVYDLNLTIVGPYESIYNFIYSIENDDDLLFEIVDLNIEPYMIKTTTTISSPTGGSNSSTDYPHNTKETITSEPIVSVNKNNTEANSTTVTTNENKNENTTTNTNTTQNNTNKTKTDIVYDPKNVQAEFTIENVTISFN